MSSIHFRSSGFQDVKQYFQFKVNFQDVKKNFQFIVNFKISRCQAKFQEEFQNFKISRCQEEFSDSPEFQNVKHSFHQRDRSQIETTSKGFKAWTH